MKAEEACRLGKGSAYFFFRGNGSGRFLYGVAAICFALALATFRFGDAVLPMMALPLSTLLYVAIFVSLGLILTVLGRSVSSAK